MQRIITSILIHSPQQVASVGAHISSTTPTFTSRHNCQSHRFNRPVQSVPCSLENGRLEPKFTDAELHSLPLVHSFPSCKCINLLFYLCTARLTLRIIRYKWPYKDLSFQLWSSLPSRWILDESHPAYFTLGIINISKKTSWLFWLTVKLAWDLKPI